jgi:PBSX family phage terminase large subunit
MEIKTFSPKQTEILKFAYNDEETLVCDGAVRSGKTIVMSLGFVLWGMSNFDRCNFAICGKTVSNAERNILRPFQQIEGMPFTLNYKISNRMLTVRCGKKENYFYLFGGKDESSYALIQGLTLAGVLFDEVALMPQSFVDQAIARTLSFANAKIWFNCNPESPNHWFYKEWITNPDRKYKHLHFLMNDNPILTEKEIQRAESLFTGVFYDRYIKGLWVRAEGIIFPEFANNPSRWIINPEDVPKRFRNVIAGLDIGGNGSHHAMVCTAEGYDGNYYVLKSIDVIPADMNMIDIEKMVIDFCEDVENKYECSIELINSDWVDVVINSINDNTPYRCSKTYKPPLEDRPLTISRLFATDQVKFVDGMCDSLIEQLQNVVYDDKSDRAIICDDGSMCIDNVDAWVYSFDNWNYLTI